MSNVDKSLVGRLDLGSVILDVIEQVGQKKPISKFTLYTESSLIYGENIPWKIMDKALQKLLIEDRIRVIGKNSINFLWILVTI